MRATVLALLFAAFTARGACIDPMRIPVGPRTVETQCSYSGADIVAEGSLVVGAWVTRTLTGFSRPYSIGSTAGGALDARGRLRSAAHVPMNDMPGTPSLATNGQMSMLAWSRAEVGTFVQFLDANGARIGEAKKVSQFGLHYTPPRALWNGRDWLVLVNETPDVAALRIGVDGTVLERTVIAQNATIGDADGSRIVVKSAAGFELIAPDGRHALPIPADAVIAVDGDLVAWARAVGGADALRLDTREPVYLGGPADGKTIAVAGDVVLWSDGALVRGARISGNVGRPLVAFDGYLYAAAETSDGVVALTSGACFAAVSRFLPQGASTFEAPDAVSRAAATQQAAELVATSRGHHVFWREPRPVISGARVLAAHVEGSAARPPVVLSDVASIIDDVAATAVGAGSAVAWVEYLTEQPRAVLKLARLDAEGRLLGAPVPIARASSFHDFAMTAQGETITVVSVERETFAYVVDVWKTTVVRDGAVTRERLAPNVDGWSPSAAVTRNGVVASWYDYVEDRDVLRLTVHHPAGTRTFPVIGVNRQQLFGGATPLILWHGRDDVHALFPESSVDVIAGSPEPLSSVTMHAEPQPDGSFQVAWAPWSRLRTTITIVNVTPAGVVTPREELCFAAAVDRMTVRGGTVDAFITHSDGAAFVARRPPPRRRAAGH